MEVRQPLARRTPARRNRLIREEKPVQANTDVYKTLFSAVLMIAGIGFGVFVFPLIERQANRPVAKIVVSGDLVYLNRRDIMNHIDVSQGDHLLDVNLAAIQQELEQMEWVHSARVSRQWPDVITVNIVEEKPIAYWNETGLLNPYGEVFERAGKTTGALPLLSGIEGAELNVIRRFEEFSQVLSPLGLKIVRLQQDEQLAWEVEVDNGIRLKLGSTRGLEKMRRFVFLYETRLRRESRPVAIVDLRYNNGAAVTWRSAAVES